MALESYIEPGGWTNWRQHPWTPSGILPVPADPEAAWEDFCEWCRPGPYQAAQPLLRQETYLRIFTESKPYHAWQLRRPEDSDPQVIKVCPWCGEKCLGPKPREAEATH